MLQFVRFLQFYHYPTIGILDILFVYLFVIGTMLHCFTLRVHLDTLPNGSSPVPVITDSETYNFWLLLLSLLNWDMAHWIP